MARAKISASCLLPPVSCVDTQAHANPTPLTDPHSSPIASPILAPLPPRNVRALPFITILKSAVAGVRLRLSAPASSPFVPAPVSRLSLLSLVSRLSSLVSRLSSLPLSMGTNRGRA